MKITKTFVTGFIFLSLGILLLFFFFFLYNQIKSLNESSDLVMHTNVVKLKLSEAIISLTDAEAAQREYLLTHDSVFLAPYKNEYSHFMRSFDEIDSLVKDNPEQEINILAIKIFSKDRLMAQDRLMNLPRNSENLTSYLLVAEIKMDNIRTQINKMSRVEDSLLNKRVKLSAENKSITPVYSLVFFSFTLLILIFSFLKINKNLQAQRKLSEDLKKANEELVLQRGLSEILIENIPDMIMVYNRDLNITLWNKKSEENTDMKRQDVIGKNIFEIFPIYNTGKWKALINRVFEGESLHHEKIKFLHRDGYGESFIIPLTKSDGEIIGSLAITRDITALVNATSALKQKNEELKQSNQELTSFSYVASHDLQEPLRKIQSFSHRILEKEGDQFSETTRDYFKRIVSAASRMQSLIEALLHFSRTNSSDLVFESDDLNSILEEVKTNLRITIEEKGALIESSVLPVIQVIPLQFYQLILNVVGNALKYSKPGVTPHIKIFADIIDRSDIIPPGIYPFKNYWRIRIEDNGIGFEQQYEQKIFELFQRLHGKLEYGGTGIGLAISKKIVQNHHGIISATGKPGIGSEFRIYLPISIN